MIKHIVLWKFNESANGKTMLENAKILEEKLFAMKDKVEGIIKLEVGVNFAEGAEASDVVLYSEFSSKEALTNYDIHPDHQAIKVWLKDVRYERRVIDFEVND